MEISNVIIDYGESLGRHTLGDLVSRLEGNVDTENMPDWDMFWKGYHYVVNINNLRRK